MCAVTVWDPRWVVPVITVESPETLTAFSLCIPHIVSSTVKACDPFAPQLCQCYLYVCLPLPHCSILPVCQKYNQDPDYSVITHQSLINLIHTGVSSSRLTSGGPNTRSHNRYYDNTAISILSIIQMISQGWTSWMVICSNVILAVLCLSWPQGNGS